MFYLELFSALNVMHMCLSFFFLFFERICMRLCQFLCIRKDIFTSDRVLKQRGKGEMVGSCKST
jgi:hypothetical protein